MPYLLDSNVLIQAKNEYYAFHLCPGFWEWIRREHAAGNVFSISRVRDELMEGNDELAEWAGCQSGDFFLEPDRSVGLQMAEVTQWVMNQNFKEAAKRDFLAKADPIIIAMALAHPEFIVVTHEVHIEGERKKVKIPTVCQALGVKYERTFTMLTKTHACFGLLTKSEES